METGLDSFEETPESKIEEAIGNLAWALNTLETRFGEESAEMAFLDKFLDEIKAITPERYSAQPSEPGAYNQNALIIDVFAVNEPAAIAHLLLEARRIVQTNITVANEDEDTPITYTDEQLMFDFKAALGFVIQLSRI